MAFDSGEPKIAADAANRPKSAGIKLVDRAIYGDASSGKNRSERRGKRHISHENKEGSSRIYSLIVGPNFGLICFHVAISKGKALCRTLGGSG